MYIYHQKKYGFEISIYLYIVGVDLTGSSRWEMTLKKNWRENRYFPDFKWSNHFSDGFIEFYGQKNIYIRKKLDWIHGSLILEGKRSIFLVRGRNWSISTSDVISQWFTPKIRPPWTQTKIFPIYIFFSVEFDKTIRKIIGPLEVGKIAFSRQFF